MAKFCTECGSPLAEGARFCTSCGKPVPGFTAPAAAVVSSVSETVAEAESTIAKEAAVVTESVESAVEAAPEAVAEAVEEAVPEAAAAAPEVLTPVENTVKEAVPTEGWFSTGEVPAVNAEKAAPVVEGTLPPAGAAPVTPTATVPPVTEQYVPVPPVGGAAPAGEPAKKKGHKGLIIGIIAFLLLAGAAVAAYFLFFSKKPVNLNDYITVTFEKYDGYGDVKIGVDKERFVQETAPKINIKEATGEEAAELLTLLYASAAEAEYDADDGSLSNGDKVKIVWDKEVLESKEGKDFLNELGIKLNYQNFEVTVEGLEDLHDFDPFQKVELDLSGRTGFGYLYLNYPYKDEYSYLSFEADKTSDLSNGDQVVVTCHVSDTDELARRFGCKLESETLTKTYTISTLEDILSYDVFESIIVTFTGYDGYGDVQLEQKSDDYYWSIGFSTSEYERGTLKNGDKITVICKTYSTLEEIARDHGWQPAGPLEKEYVVEGLQEYEKVDVFEYLDYEFTGEEGNGTLTISWKEDAPEFTRYINFEKKTFTGLSNGDKVTIKITGYSRQEKYIIQDYGMLADPLEKEITVEGFSVPLTDASQITPALEAQLRSECESWLQESADYGDATLKAMDYVGSYVAHNPDGSPVNVLMPVYQITLDLWGTELVFGLAFEVDELKILPDGTSDTDGEPLDPVPMNNDAFKITFNVENPADKQVYEYWAYGFDKEYIPTYDTWLSEYLELEGYTWTLKTP